MHQANARPDKHAEVNSAPVSVIVEVTIANFEEVVLKSPKPVVLVFTSKEKCAPCRTLEPRLERVAVEFSEKLVVAKHDPWHDQSLAQKFNVVGVPNLLYFFGGNEVKRNVGKAS